MSRAWAGHPCKYLICPSPGETSKATSKLAPFSKGVTHGKRALQIESSSGCAKAKVLTNSQNWGARDWPKSLWGELFWAPRGPPQCLDLERMWILMIFLDSAIQPFQLIIWWTSMSSLKARSRMRRIQMDGRGSSILHYIENVQDQALKQEMQNAWNAGISHVFLLSLEVTVESWLLSFQPRIDWIAAWTRRYAKLSQSWTFELYLVTLGRYSATLLRPRSTS